MAAPLSSLVLEAQEFVSLLGDLVSETPNLMNDPPQHVPQESLAAQHVLKVLSPLSVDHGGPLVIKEVKYAPKRSNLIITYPAATESKAAAGPPTVSFVGSHMDVVVADPAQWKKDPFKLDVSKNEQGQTILYGRGTTDCLGHVALLTNLFKQLATTKPKLAVSVVGVLIADEESGGSDDEVGVDGLMKKGELAQLKDGPVYWLDCADMQPNIGSGGVVQWELKANGYMFHSGFPNKAINAIELANLAVQHIQTCFYRDFPTHPQEKVYGFPCGSSFKPTNIATTAGSLNQIKGACTVQGDIRLVPFYKIKDAMASVEKAVAEFNSSVAEKCTSGPFGFKPVKDQNGVDHKAEVELKWLGAGMDGLACDLNSSGFKALANATKKFVGKVEPLADTGSLPLVADLQAAGYDVQTVGYGVEDAYHANDEFARLEDFQTGFKILCAVIDELHNRAATTKAS